MKRKKVIYLNDLRLYRKMIGYSQLEVADILDIKDSALISKWEQGTTMPSLPNMFKLSILYSTLSDALFFELVSTLRKDVLAKKQKNKKAQSISNKNNKIDSIRANNIYESKR